jgi:inner membrane protein
VFWFLSIPISRNFAHRSLTHSLILWAPLTTVSFYVWEPIGWLCVGAITHFMLDTLNVGGVQLMAPLSEKVFVFGGRTLRIPVSSRSEWVFFFCLCVFAYGCYLIHERGGMRTVIGTALGSYEITKLHYEGEGTRVCHINGNLRYPNGEIDKNGRWLIIGTEGEWGLCIYDEKKNRTLHVPEDGKFLYCNLETEDRHWTNMELEFYAEVKDGSCFYLSEKGWRQARSGDFVSGSILHAGGLSLAPVVDL